MIGSIESQAESIKTLIILIVSGFFSISRVNRLYFSTSGGGPSVMYSIIANLQHTLVFSHSPNTSVYRHLSFYFHFQYDLLLL
jgi:hypothetical protein